MINILHRNQAVINAVSGKARWKDSLCVLYTATSYFQVFKEKYDVKYCQLCGISSLPKCLFILPLPGTAYHRDLGASVIKKEANY